MRSPERDQIEQVGQGEGPRPLVVGGQGFLGVGVELCAGTREPVFDSVDRRMGTGEDEIARLRSRNPRAPRGVTPGTRGASTWGRALPQSRRETADHSDWRWDLTRPPAGARRGPPGEAEDERLHSALPERVVPRPVSSRARPGQVLEHPGVERSEGTPRGMNAKEFVVRRNLAQRSDARGRLHGLRPPMAVPHHPPRTAGI